MLRVPHQHQLASCPQQLQRDEDGGLQGLRGSSKVGVGWRVRGPAADLGDCRRSLHYSSLDEHPVMQCCVMIQLQSTTAKLASMECWGPQAVNHAIPGRCSIAGAALQLQHCRCSIAGAALQVQHSRCSIAGAALQVQHCRCSIAGAALQSATAHGHLQSKQGLLACCLCISQGVA